MAKAAHELRGAVGGIELMAEALVHRLEEEGDGELASLLRQLSGQSARVQTMTHQLLDLTRFGDGRTPLHAEPVPVAALIDQVLTAEPPGLRRTVELNIDDDLAIITDPLALEQILTNLVRNAYRHGGDTIGLMAEVVGDRVVLDIVDDGPGVPDELRPKLFEPFTRGSSRAGGTGLGLAIVAELVVVLRGTIEYRPVEPCGAGFRVVLPRYPFGAATTAIAASERAPAPRTESA